MLTVLSKQAERTRRLIFRIQISSAHPVPIMALSLMSNGASLSRRLDCSPAVGLESKLFKTYLKVMTLQVLNST